MLGDSIHERTQIVKTANAIVIGFLLAGCTPETQNVPTGHYRASTNNEHVRIQGKAIRLVIRLDESKTNIYDRTFADHSVLTDGRIQPFPMREVDYVLGAGRFDWKWDGTNIVKYDRDSKKCTVFIFSND